MGRRPNHTGTVYKSNGKYVGEIRFTINGVLYRKQFSGTSERKVRKELKKYKEEKEHDLYIAKKESEGEDAHYIDDEMHACLLIKQGTLKMSSFESLYLVSQKYILPVIGRLTLSEFNMGHAETVINNMVELGLSESRIRKAISCMRNFYDYEIRKYRLYENGKVNFISFLTIPKSKIKPKKKITPLSNAECVAFIETVKSHRDSVYAPICLFLIYTGLRVAEAAAVHKDNYNASKRILRIDRTLVIAHEYVDLENSSKCIRRKEVQFSTKTASGNRIIPLSDNAMDILDNWVVPNEEGYMFTGKTGNFFDIANIREFAAKCLKEIGVDAREKGSTLHLLRHSFASALFASGTPLKTVSEILGHSGIQITADIYVDTLNELEFGKAVECQFNPCPEHLR